LQLEQPYSLRQAHRTDSRAIRALIRMVGINPLGLDWRKFIIAVDEQGSLIGCGQIKTHKDGSLELASIAVRPGRTLQGVATLIIRELLNSSKRPVYLTCRFGLNSFYEKFSFTQIPSEEMPPYFHLVATIAGWLFRKKLLSDGLLVMRLDK